MAKDRGFISEIVSAAILGAVAAILYWGLPNADGVNRAELVAEPEAVPDKRTWRVLPMYWEPLPPVPRVRP